MLTLRNEPDDGHVITVVRVPAVDAGVPSIPAGTAVRIVGVDTVDGRAAFWLVAWRGSAYVVLPSELRPARLEEAFV